MIRRATVLLVALCASQPVFAQTCPKPLQDAKRLLMVTAKTMTSLTATAQRFERASLGDPWKAVSQAEPAVLGKAGIGWSFAFRAFARDGEPLKREGDKRTPAGFYRLGRSFGFAASPRANYLRLADDTVCVNDPKSPAYNTITSRTVVGRKVRGEDMWRIARYRHGLVVDYPTNRSLLGGSCIFLHVWRAATSGTAGCVALPAASVTAIQDFTKEAAILAVLPQSALDRFAGCLPAAR